MNKFMLYIKTHKLLAALFVGLVLLGYYLFLRDDTTTLYEATTVKRGDVIQEVSVTGRVESASVVLLSFEKGGRVNAVPRAVGAKVGTGDVLVRVDSRELDTLRAQAKANLDYEVAKLADLKKGSRPEDIRIAESKVNSAETTVLDARTALTDKQANALTVADDSLFNKTDHLLDNPRGSNPKINFPTTDTKLAMQLEGARAGLTNALNTLPAADLGLDASLPQDKQYFTILRAYLDDLASAVNAVLPSSSYSQTTIDGWKSDVSLARTNLNTAVTALLTAEQTYRSALGSLAIAQDELSLKRVGPTAESLAAQEAKIAAGAASIANYDVQISKSFITAPFAGTVTRQDAKFGETVTPNTPLVGLMSNGRFTITTNVPEVDVAKLTVGDEAKVTLDAYGSDVPFEAKITSIDPAETIIEGVSTYKVTLHFMKDDERIRSGMTANIDVLTEKRENVLFVPSRAVSTKDGAKIVRLLPPPNVPKDAVPEEVVVEVGLRGSDGMIEIVSGLSEGQSIVTFTK